VPVVQEDKKVEHDDIHLNAILVEAVVLEKLGGPVQIDCDPLFQDHN